jgi:hypothetical protein
MIAKEYWEKVALPETEATLKVLHFDNKQASLAVV